MQTRRFRILAELGRGGHGQVFRAIDAQLGRTVAIKVFQDSQAEAGRLMSEARTLSQLSHSGIVSVHDISQISMSPGSEATITLSEDEEKGDDQLIWAMVMEDLGDVDPQTHVREEGPQAALRLVAAIAEALDYAHSRGIYHCDVKRSNVRVVDGKAKLFDFSLAGRRPGRPYGTPAYRAPEQSRGEEPTDRTDVYGLGWLLYELLSQESAQPGTVPRLPDVNGVDRRTRRAAQELLQAMLAANPQARPAMPEVAARCRGLLRLEKTTKRLPSYAAALATAALSLPVLVTLWTRQEPANISAQQADKPFAVTVHVHASDEKPAWPAEALSVQVILDLDRDRRSENIDAAGDAIFRDVPGKFRGQLVPLEIRAPGYAVFDDKTRALLSGEPLDISLKREAMPTPARLRVAIGLVHQGTNVLMVRRRHREGSLMWQFPAGIVKPPQEPEQRVLDETLKETGISIKLLRKIGERISPDTRAHAIYFDCAYLGGRLHNGDPEENVEVAWVPAGEVTSRVTSSLYGGVRDLLKGIEDGRAL